MKRALAAAGLLLGLALLASPARAQTGTARGRVVDTEGKPIVEAKVLIEFQGGINRKFETKTNKKGEYMQVGMQPGPYRLTASKEGFQPIAVDCHIALGDATVVPDLKLAPGAVAGATADDLRKEFQAALALTTDKKYDEAEAAYKAILAKSPDVPEVYQNLGWVYQQKKNLPAAEAAYLKALELRPGSNDITGALASIYREMGQPDKALALIEKAAGENPADAKAQFNRGIFLLNSNQTEPAVKAFEAAIAADPNMAEAYFRLGTQQISLGKIPEAIANLEKYVSLSPTDAANVATAQGLIKALKK
jgi:tetratricopeptide (TPR) repeat protein